MSEITQESSDQPWDRSWNDEYALSPPPLPGSLLTLPDPFDCPSPPLFTLSIDVFWLRVC